MKRMLPIIIFFQLSGLVTLGQKPVILMDNEPGWQRIGETTASFDHQSESIVVLGDDEFASIKLRVEDAPLMIDRLQVFYESGEARELDVKDEIAAGAESREFQLDPNMEIEKVAFTYRTLPNDNDAKANITLLGFVKSGNDDGDEQRTAYRSDTGGREGNSDPENISSWEDSLFRDDHATGDKFPEEASKGAAGLTHKRYEDKVGPNGQVIYIEPVPDRYYYIDPQGQKVYLSKVEMRDKKE